MCIHGWVLGKMRTEKKCTGKNALGKKHRYNYINRSKFLFTAEFLSHLTLNMKMCVI